MERFRQDLGLGIRSLLRQPAVAAAAVLTLALAIGANVTMMSFAGAMLFPSLPYEDPDRLVVVERHKIEPTGSPLDRLISFPALVDWKDQNQVFSQFSFLRKDNHSLTSSEGEPEHLESLLVSANLLATLGVEPAVGRGFEAEDDHRGAVRKVMLSHDFWQRRFAGDPAVVGDSIHLDELVYTVIGVLPQSLTGEALGKKPLGDIWLPVALFYDLLPVDDRAQQEDWVMVCRLKPGINLTAARADMKRVTENLAREYKSTDDGREARVETLREHLVGEFRPMILALLGSVVFVLFLACANLVHLLLARFVARRQEFAVRSALGANRRRLVAQSLNEAMVLTLVGCMVGLVMAFTLVQVLPRVLSEIPYTNQARISPAIVIYTLLLSGMVTLVIGLIPALQILSPSWQKLLTGSLGARSAPSYRRLRQALVVAELALAVVLLTGTGLALITFFNLRDEDLGFSSDRVLSLDVALPKMEYGEWAAFYDQALRRTGALAGVRHAAVVQALPMSDRIIFVPAYQGGVVPPIEDRTRSSFFVISPDYFQTMGIPLLHGRELNAADDERLGGKKVVVISQALAKEFWPDDAARALGKEFAFEIAGGNMENPLLVPREIVGVVDDTRYEDVRTPPTHAIYVSYTQPFTFKGSKVLQELTLLLKTEVEPTSLAPVVRAELKAIAPNHPVHSFQTLQGIVNAELIEAKMILVLLSLFAGIGLIIALVGIYGVVSFLVTSRYREIGIRMALGAAPFQVLAGLLVQGLVVICGGLVAGLALAAVLTRLMKTQLHEVSPVEPTVLVAVSVILGVMALLATLMPALQATRIDPARSLRDQ